MHSHIQDLKVALQEVVESYETSKHKYLAVNRQGKGYNFYAIHLSRWDAFKRTFGFGDTCPKKVARALLQESEVLQEAVNERGQNQILQDNKIEKWQGLMERIFTAAKRPLEVPNLYKGKYASWMEKLLPNTHIHDILLPGTHDSAAYQVDFTHTLPRFKKIKKLVRFLPFVGKIIINWTKTQDKSIGEQLNEGFRYFDFRISYHPEENKFYLTHTFTCVPFEEALNQIHDFMMKHPKEVILIAAESDWEHQEGMNDFKREQEMVGIVQEKLKGLLSPPPPSLHTGSSDSMTLENLVKNNYRIFFYYNSRAGHADRLEVWNGQLIKSSGWANSSDLKISLEKMDEGIQSNPTAQGFFSTAFILTPQVKDIVKSIIQKIFLPWKKMRSLRDMAKEIEHSVEDYLDRRKEKLKNVNIIVTDFPRYDFVHKVIKSQLTSI